jgi:serine protease Do
MRFFKSWTAAALCATLAGLGVVAGGLRGQTTSQPAQKTSDPSTSTEQKCLNAVFDREQIAGMLRSMRLEEKLSGLSQQLAKEEAMSSPELAKLQNLSARLEARGGELEAQAEEMSANAQEMASRVANGLQEGNVFVSPDENSGWLGVEIDEVTPEKAKDLKLADVRGVILRSVEPDGPAAKAGLKQNDVIVEYDGQTVEGTVQFRRLVRETPPRRNVNLTIVRNGETQKLSVEVADRNAYYEKSMGGMARDLSRTFSFSAPNFNLRGPETLLLMNAGTPVLGIDAEDLNGQLGAYFGAPGDAGVLVRSVRAGTPAQRAGLKAGDVIIKFDGTPVKSVSGLRDQLQEKRDQKTVTLGVVRKGSELNVSVNIEQPKPEVFQGIHSASL